MLLAILVLAVVCIAYANGANDNFKGVATLFGSGTTDYRASLIWATATTFAGSMTAVFLAGALLKSFSGKGIVAAELAALPQYGAAVALGAGLTVLLATRIGMPVSTTHGLVGALVGTGFAAGSAVDTQRLIEKVMLPLLVSPVVAIVVTTLLYLVFRNLRQRLGVEANSCFCVGSQLIETVPVLSPSAAVHRVEQLTMSTGDAVTCRSTYSGKVLGIDASTTLDRLHFLSAGAVSFARGLNDTPKMAAMLLLVPAFSAYGSLVMVGGVIALGGWLSARRVAETMSHQITPMNHGQGFTANLVTSCIVIGASRFGMPVSTTHVSCGSLFGIGAATGEGRWRTIRTILAAWMLTLPAGAILGALAWMILSY